MSKARNEIKTNRLGLNSDEIQIQELSRREMEHVTGGGWRREVGAALCAASALVCLAAHAVHEATKD